MDISNVYNNIIIVTGVLSLDDDRVISKESLVDGFETWKV